MNLHLFSFLNFFFRKGSVKRKLNAMPSEFQGKAILLIDDSIIRGTTSKEVIKMARDAGARKVFFACCSPPLRFQNNYGIETPASEEFMAYNRNASEIALEMGADAVIYLPVECMVRALQKCNPDISEFELSMVTGVYITETEGSSESLEGKREE